MKQQDSGSRGTGAAVCDHYSRIAISRFADLPDQWKRLAWLSLDSQEGQEYWAAMELMGQYAAANHACIHRHIAGHLGTQVLLDLENHHNYAWKEKHVLAGVEREVIVHRKGATPAGVQVISVVRFWSGSVPLWTKFSIVLVFRFAASCPVRFSIPLGSITYFTRPAWS